MSFQTLFTKLEDHTLIITINRPDVLNALNKQVIDDLDAVMDRVYKFPEIKSVVITGAGLKSFVAGADISEFADFSVAEGQQLAAQGQALLFDFIANLQTPVIAAVNGFALGGGLELAMAAHFRVASDSAKMGLPEVSLGVIPGYGGTQRLPQLIGKGRAMELIMTAGMIDAAKAYEYGLVNHVTTQDELLVLAQKIASKIARNSSVAIAAAIKSLISDSLSWAGRYVAIISPSAFSISALSLAPACSKASAASRLFLASLERTVITSASLSSLASLPETSSFLIAVKTIRIVPERSSFRSRID